MIVAALIVDDSIERVVKSERSIFPLLDHFFLIENRREQNQGFRDRGEKNLSEGYTGGWDRTKDLNEGYTGRGFRPFLQERK